jgi:hypothetical protein
LLNVRRTPDAGTVDTVMRVTTFIAVVATALLTGCEPGPPGATPPALAPGPPTSTATGGPATPTPTPTPNATKTRTTTKSDDQLPTPLPGPDRRLTGVVQRIGTCTMLLVAPRRWALMGPVAAKLKPGERVTVTGPMVPSPTLCSRYGAEQAVQVTHATMA